MSPRGSKLSGPPRQGAAHIHPGGPRRDRPEGGRTSPRPAAPSGPSALRDRPPAPPRSAPDRIPGPDGGSRVIVHLLLACEATPIALAPEPSAKPEALPADTAPPWTECAAPQAVRLNEVVAANVHGAVDADGDSSDWFELALVDGAPATALAGWGLSDDGVGPWPVPEVELGAAPLQVWASGKDRTDGELHVDFALDAGGDALFLHAPDGCVADHLTTPRMYADTAYGRDVGGTWAWFVEPTPGRSNTPESRPGFAEAPRFDLEGGVVPAGTTVAATGPGTVRYTLDGRVPDADDDVWGATVRVPADGVLVVRARSFVDGLWPSRPATRTWFGEEGLDELGVTLLALTAEPDDLFHPATGIHEYGPPDYETWYPYFGANFWEVWERDVHVELHAPDGRATLDTDAGIQIAGGYSRAFDQRNFELIAREGYGDAVFGGQVFPEEEVDTFSRLYLRNGGDWCSSQIVDASVQALFRDADGTRDEAVDAQAYTPTMVWINGEFWGVYELKERLDESWPAAHRGADPDDLDLVKLGWTHDANWTLEAGDWAAFDTMEAAVAADDLRDDDALAAFLTMVDGDNLAAAAVAQGWIGNSDWWWNNLRLWRPRDDGARWRWMVYDFGHGWPDVRTDHLATTVGGTWEGMPLGEMLLNPGYADRFAAIHADYFNTSLRGDEAAARVRALADEVRPVMERQRDRWCAGAPMAAWEDIVDYAATFAERRADVMEGQLRLHLGVGPPTALELDADPADAARFHLAVVTVAAPFAGHYPEGVPVEVTVVPEPGWRLAGWSDGALGADATVTLPMTAATALTAFLEPE